jgi:lysophospholipase L1-like esterase
MARVIGVIVLLLASGAASSAAAPPKVTAVRQLPRVTLISDSVAASIPFDTGAKTILAAGIDLFLEPGPARLLGGENPVGAIAPPTAVQLIPMLGHRLGATVIMDVGYNDVSAQYAANLEAALAELNSAGVKHVLWVTLHFSPAHLGYQVMNDAIAAAATHHPELTIVDWNTYASDHPEWFQSDQVHLTGDGPRALARLFHASLVKLGIPARRS